MTFPNYPAFNGVSPTIMNVGGTDFKLATQYRDSSTSIVHKEIYSLPGSLPCNACGGFVGINRPVVSNGYPNIYPNPGSERVQISYDLQDVGQNATLQIINTSGQVVETYNLGSAFNFIEIDTSQFPSGIYHYVVEGKRNKVSGSFIIK
jgi:hypothetical protein